MPSINVTPAMAETPRLPLHVSFFVPGTPATAGSKKGFYNKKLNRVLMVPDNAKTKPWMAQVSAFAMEAMCKQQKVSIVSAPVLLWVEFRLQRPKGHFRANGETKHNAPRFVTTKPDLTKLIRAIEDAMTGIVWGDDSQVAIQNTTKVYVNPGEIPGALVQVYLLSEDKTE